MYRYDEIDTLIDELGADEGDPDPIRVRPARPKRQQIWQQDVPVTCGVTATISARPEPSTCSASYTVRLWQRSVDHWARDKDYGARTLDPRRFFTRRGQTVSWTGLPSGNYYLVINSGDNPPCNLTQIRVAFR